MIPERGLVATLQSRLKENYKTLVIIGDVMTDIWVHGSIVLSCQDDCLKFVEQYRVRTLGGAANAENCLRNWNAPTLLYGQSQAKCPVKTRFVVDTNKTNKIVFRSDDEVGVVDDGMWGAIRSSALSACTRAGAVLLCDYDKGILTRSFINHVVRVCEKRKIPCVADCKRPPDVYRGTILKCNSEYYKRNFDAIRGLFQSWVATNGSEPPYVQHVKGSFYPSNRQQPVECENHVGAGDCFAAHLALALAHGFSLEEAATLAHSAGRVYVQHPHNCPPDIVSIGLDLSAE